MLSSDKNKQMLGQITNILVLVGAVNWGVTAMQMKADDEVKDLLYTINKQMPLPISLTTAQKAVYAAVTLSAIATIAQSRM